jgi:hypothetical protein
VISRKQFFQRIATPPTVKPSNSQRKISNAPPPSTANRTLSANSQVSSRSSFSTSSSSFKLTTEEEKGYDIIEAKKQVSSSVITPSQPLQLLQGSNSSLVMSNTAAAAAHGGGGGHNHKLKKKKSKKFGNEPPPRVDPPRDRDPPTLTDYLLHLFDGNKLRSIHPSKLTDSQFFWLLNDLGLGLSDDEVSVLCRRAPQAANHKVDWSSFAPRLVCVSVC